MTSSTKSSPNFTLVPLPGFMTDRALWSRMEAGLAELGPCHYGDFSGLTDLKTTAREILDTVPGPLLPVGFSLGGYVAREMARQAPDRLAGLVLMNTSPRPPRPEIISRNTAIAEKIRERGFRGLSPAGVRKSLHPDLRGDDAMVQEVLDMAQRLGGETFINQLVLQRPDGRADLAAISCPALVIWSRQDELRSMAESQEMADAIPGARLEIIENAGHMTPMEAPEASLSLIRDWISENGL